MNESNNIGEWSMKAFLPEQQIEGIEQSFADRACAQPPVMFVELNGELGHCKYSALAFAGPIVPAIV